MTEMMIDNNFDLDAVFSDFEQEVKMTNILFLPKNGSQLYLAVLPPLMYEGKPRIHYKVDNEFTDPKTKKVTQSNQYIVRFAVFGFTNRKVDWAKTEFVGIPLARTYAEQISLANQKGFKIATQEFNLIEYQKQDKTLITFLPQMVRMPDELWAKGCNTPTWEELVEAHVNVRANVANKQTAEKKTEALW